MPLPLVVSLVAPLVAKVIPSLVGKLFGDNGEDIANKVVDTAKKITGIDDPGQAIAGVEKDPKLLPLFIKELDVEIEEIRSFTQVQQALAQADIAGASTRPKISLMLAYVLCYAEIMAISFWALAVYKNEVSLENSWPLMLAILGPVVALLRAYFGMRTKEKKARYELAGKPPDHGLIGTIAGLFKK